MFTKLTSGAILGLNSIPIDVEVDIASQGLPSFTLVGLGDRAVEESKERVRSAIRNSGADFPSKRITVNLAPADLPKDSSSFDLAIALGLLKATGQIEANLEDTLVIGELSLDGTLRPVSGVLIHAILARDLSLKRIFLPIQNVTEAAMVSGIEVYGFSNLAQTVKFLMGLELVTPEPQTELEVDDVEYEYDFKDIKGQEQAKRALEIAASGGHNVILKGPPGAGKTLLARCFPSILPPLTEEEVLEVTKIYSLSGFLSGGLSAITRRPFRSPHHTASYVGIIGGGNTIRPGEVTLAHRGVLFLDEFPEFGREVLESLRQPLEDRVISISRASGTLKFPCQFILLAAQNPCPCGFLGSLNRNCICMPGQILRYKKRVSGPLLDRMDIHLEVPAVEVDKLTSNIEGEDSKSIRSRVKMARKIQQERFKGTEIFTNSEMSNSQIKKFCSLDPEGVLLLKAAITKMRLSARSYHRILKLSRTIADLGGSEEIGLDHLSESLTYRFQDTYD
ncbi:MAG: YifB family Mg chelatase-like AAA ATPase [Candidatus Daviesbacteria bacterium]|nr:YifB family Mg chelatase-like AAA ATPase [Candidatus Daviesbacteria bacterium]